MIFSDLFYFYKFISIFIGFIITHYYVLPYSIPIHIRAGLFGKDIYLKKVNPEKFNQKIAESLGLGIACVYFMIMLSLYLITKLINKHYLSDLLLLVLSYISFGTMLGFVDDILNLRWRHKLIYPFFFSLPIILNYVRD